MVICVKNSAQFVVSVCYVCQECNILVFKFRYGKKVMEKKGGQRNGKKEIAKETYICKTQVCYTARNVFLHCDIFLYRP